MHTRPQVVVLDPYHHDALQVLQGDASIELILPESADKSMALAQATGILIRGESRISAADIESAGADLKYIIKQGAGVDSIDLDAAKSKGIGVYNTPGLNAEAVAELTLTLALCVARRVTELDRLIRSGEKLIRSKMLGKSLFGTSLGVVGMGAIGVEMARKWSAAMNGPIIAYDPFAAENAWVDIFGPDGFTRVHNLHDLLGQADVVTLHVPLTKDTSNLMSEAEFNAMRDDSILLNCARGGVVDEGALLRALQSGKLFGAGLDAMVHEPPTLSDYGDTLLQHPRVVMTPHVGASTEDNQSRSGTRAAEIMLDLVHGRGNHKSLA